MVDTPKKAVLGADAALSAGMRGSLTFHDARARIFGRPPAELGDVEFIRLVAVLIAPGQYDLTGGDAALDERVDRIERLVAGICSPSGVGDVWLEGCRQSVD